MLKSYQAIYENGQIKWLTDKPRVDFAHLIVTVLDEGAPPVQRRSAPASIAGKGETLGDLVEPIVSDGDCDVNIHIPGRPKAV